MEVSGAEEFMEYRVECEEDKKLEYVDRTVMPLGCLEPLIDVCRQR